MSDSRESPQVKVKLIVEVDPDVATIANAEKLSAIWVEGFWGIIRNLDVVLSETHPDKCVLIGGNEVLAHDQQITLDAQLRLASKQQR